MFSYSVNKEINLLSINFILSKLFSYIRIKYTLVHFLHTLKNILHHNIKILKSVLNIWRYNILFILRIISLVR